MNTAAYVEMLTSKLHPWESLLTIECDAPEKRRHIMSYIQALGYKISDHYANEEWSSTAWPYMHATHHGTDTIMFSLTTEKANVHITYDEFWMSEPEPDEIFDFGGLL